MASIHYSSDGTTLSLRVRVIDPATGEHVDPDGWSANPNSANVVIQEQPSAVHTGTKLGVGEYRFNWTGLTPIAENTAVHCEINGAISGTAWSEWIEDVLVVRIPLTTLGTNAPAGWINAAAIAASALNGKGDWLVSLGTNAPAGWINAAAIASAALNGKGDWLTTLGTNAPAGWINATAIASNAFTSAKFAAGAFDAVWTVGSRTLTGPVDISSSSQNAIIAGIETEVLNDATGGAVIATIAGAVAGYFDSATLDLPPQIIAAAVRNNLATELARIDVTMSSRASQTSVNTIDDFVDTEITTLLSNVASARSEIAVVDGLVDLLVARVSTAVGNMFNDLVQMIQNTGTVNAQFTLKALELAPSGGGGGGGGGVTGPGSDQVTITISDDGTPVENVSVWISTDAGGATVVAGVLVTDALGKCTFLLTAGATYYLWAQKAGKLSITGQQFVAVAD